MIHKIWIRRQARSASLRPDLFDDDDDVLSTTITTWRQRQKQNSGFNTFLLLSQCINTISKLDLIDSANLWRDSPTHAEVFRGKFTTSHHPPESLFVLTDYGLLACLNAIIEKTLQKYENNKKAKTKRRATGWHCNIRLNVEGFWQTLGVVFLLYPLPRGANNHSRNFGTTY